MSETPNEKIRRLIDSSGMSMRAVARKIGVTVVSVSRWAAGSGLPRGKNLESFCDYFDVSPAWLMYGSDDGPESTPGDPNYISVPLLNVEASCGGGAVVNSEDIVRMIRFDAAYLRKRARGANPRALHIITVRGDSMAPTVDDGDAVVIDTSDTAVRQDGVYAVQLGGMLYVKRLQLTPSCVRILSDNPLYPPIDVGEQDALRVAGRCYTGIVLRDL